MKTNLPFVFAAIIAITSNSLQKANAQANTNLSNLTSPTAVNQHLIPNNNNGRNLGSAAKSWKVLYLDSAIYLKDSLFMHTAGSANTFVGMQAGKSVTSGVQNAAFGFTSLYANTSGSQNTALGKAVLYKNTNGSFNSGSGYQALFNNTNGSYNTASGAYALFFNTNGWYNTASGYGALYLNTFGGYNTASGAYALYSNTTGNYNTANGNQSLYNNTTGSENTVNGYSALPYNTTGNYNTANGYVALYSNTTGSENTANGNQSLYYNTKGNYNTAAGSYALENNTTGYYNTAVGYYAFSQNQTGYGNTAIGVGTNLTGFTNLVDATAIGYNANVNASDKIVIGTASNNNLTGGYGTWQSFSDGRFKENVQDNVPGLAFITKLHPVTYNLNAEKIDEFLGIKQRMDTSRNAEEKARYLGRSKEVSLQLQTGFIAQEVEATAKSIGYDFDGVHHPESDKDNYTIGYATFVVPLVKAVQELSAANDVKDAKIQEQDKKIDALIAMMQDLQQNFSNCNPWAANKSSNVVSASDASLEQNVPNPFANATTIGYSLPQKFTTAQIMITDKSGKTLKLVNLAAGRQGVSGSGKGKVNVDAPVLAAGAYNYSLLVDGKLIGTKQMVLAK